MRNQASIVDHEDFVTIWDRFDIDSVMLDRVEAAIIWPQLKRYAETGKLTEDDDE